MCYDQNDSVSTGVNNLIQNGGFETTPCPASTGVIGSATSFCPNSIGYVCDLANWTCTGGGQNTYACIYNQVTNKSMIQEGNNAVYMGNYYCNGCSNTQGDTACLVNSGCTVSGPPAGFPNNPDPAYGGSVGVSIEQTVNGLTPMTIYVLEFWAGGEMGMMDPGLFAVNVGFGDTMLRNNQTPPGTGLGTRYLVEFRATNTSHTIKFTNWGHICWSCTELVLDDVRLYTLAELNPNIPPCPNSTPVAAFSGPNHICPGTCTDFTNLSSNGVSFIWSFPGGNPAVSTDANPTGICYNTPGNYSVTLIANGVNGSDTLTLNNYITVYPFPAPQGITQIGDTLFANQGATSYQWFQDGTLIPGATDYYYVATMSGNYNVVATDENDCEVEAAVFDVVAGLASIPAPKTILNIYPNPVGDEMFVQANYMKGNTVDVSIYDMLGTNVMNVFSRNPFRLNVADLPSGVYYIQLTSGNDSYRSKFVKE